MAKEKSTFKFQIRVKDLLDRLIVEYLKEEHEVVSPAVDGGLTQQDGKLLMGAIRLVEIKDKVVIIMAEALLDPTLPAAQVFLKVTLYKVTNLAKREQEILVSLNQEELALFLLTKRRQDGCVATQ